MDFVMPEYISLKDHASYDERWLQDKINENPSLLGLGDLNVRDRERRQPSAGRLDLLLTSPESDTRYVVEIQLGATDESHLIRTIEYWDIERRRFPKYEHTLNPRTGGYVVANFKIPFDEDIDKAIDDSNLDRVPYEQRLKLFRARIRKTDLDENQEVIMKLIQNAHERTASGA